MPEYHACVGDTLPNHHIQDSVFNEHSTNKIKTASFGGPLVPHWRFGYRVCSWFKSVMDVGMIIFICSIVSRKYALNSSFTAKKGKHRGLWPYLWIYAIAHH
jgi:hypothetical protein